MTSTFHRSNRRKHGVPVVRPRELGTIRQSQLVSTYGVGAMVAVDNESFIVTGIDSWDISAAQEIYERRLARLLGVRSFRLPPAPDLDDSVGHKDGVHVRRFPEFYSCSKCSALQPFFKFNPPRGTAQCGSCEVDLVPSRFVLVCDHGHIDDFPYWKWVHRGNDVSGLCEGELSLRAEGSSASLRSIIVGCSCGVPAVSMEGAFRRKALKDLAIRCAGKRPWLPHSSPESCTQQPRAMQRGSSSVWHPILTSALSIPPWGEGVLAVIEKHKLFDEDVSFIRRYLGRSPEILRGLDVSPEDVIAEVRELRRANEEQNTSPSRDKSGVGKLREEEYERLCREHPERSTSDWQSFVCVRPRNGDSALLGTGLHSSMLVTRLREVRVLSAFVRGDMPTEADSDERRAALSLIDVDWLPAMEVSGEGVFLRLDPERLGRWEQWVTSRIEGIRKNHLALLMERTKDDPKRKGSIPFSPVTPRYVLLHTLAHVLINEWSLDGGYPASALRERLYSSDSMAGLLIYTATSDSAGSLGGVVAQGDPQRLARSLRAALERAAWCSNDPLCMEADATGADSLNKAACHACLLLPETSCETFNSFLDRALLVGCSEKDVPGYFDLGS